MTQSERHQILVEWNRTEREYPRDKCVHQLFEEQAERTPEAVAVEFAERSLTYRELDVQAGRLAAHLRSLGVGPDALVGLCVERSLEMTVALLGILKAGGAYLPLDPDLPPERLAFMLQDSNLPVLITQRRLAGRVGISAAHRVWIDECGWQTEPETPPQTGPSTSLAYVLYTSGSTGQPKGVQISHQALVNCIWHFIETLKIRPHDGWMAVTTLSFDIAALEIWLPLLAGARVIVATRAMAQDGQMLNRALMATGATILQATPATWQALLHSGWQGNPKLRILCGGEALPQALADRLAMLGSCAWNLYGPTETTIYSSDNQLLPHSPVTIGRPLANTRVYILDADGRPVPIGVAGNLVIGGDGLARGYLNRPELTAERFISDPFSATPGARLYRTGDIARWRADGNIEYLGRADHQVKIRGYRIELGEIESVLGGHPGVSACTVLARDQGGGDKVLAAFVVVRKPGGLDAETLRQWLGAKLPDYMVPARFFSVPALPLTPNGKVDRKALEKTDAVELVSGTDHLAPRSQIERDLVEIWKGVLGREKVGVRDNFFHLGGHSLLAVMVCAQLRQRLNLDVSVRALFDHPTVEGLAGHLKAAVVDSSAASPVEKADQRQPLPLSFAQQGMWFLQQTLPDPATYNQPAAIHLSGPVDQDRIRRCLDVIVGRHEILRTALVRQDESLVQQVFAANECALPWMEVDLRLLAPDGQTSALEERLLAEARRPFDLALAPLWRVAWIRISGDEQVLAFTFHHSIVDEWSVRLFLRELEILYAVDAQAGLAALPPLPVQYADHALWQRRRLTGERLATHLGYWREQLRDLPPPLELPSCFPRPARPGGRGATRRFRLEGPVAARMRQLASEEGATLFTVMLAVFQVWLHRHTGAGDVVVGTPMTGRDRPEVQSLLGLFLNMLPIRTRVDPGRNFREVLRQVRATLLDALSHAELPFEQMVGLAVRDRSPRWQPLYQVMFVLLEGESFLPQLGLARGRHIPARTGTSKSDLVLSIQAGEEGWECEFEYDTDLFSGEGVAAMSRHLTELLRSIGQHPEQAVGGLNLLPESDRHQILVEWNRTEREYPRDKCVHQLFEEQVERTPEAVAVEFAERSLTYRELDAQAGRLAAHLRSLGVGPDALVGLCVERSLEMTVALLGILKAGGAYCSLDETLPDERLGWILADARPVLLLARGRLLPRLANLAGSIPVNPPVVAGIEDLLSAPSGGPCFGDPRPRPLSPVYVSYTSGSTGHPKGVVVPHRGVVRLVKGVDYASFSAAETFLHLSPLSFDASTFEIWGPLLNGGRLVLLPPGQPSLVEIGTVIGRRGVTTLWLTAGLFHLMVDERLDDLKPLRQLLAGGDVLSPGHVSRARRGLPGCRIINGYGPTENTTFTCCHTVTEENASGAGVPVGRPVSNTQVYVLDPFLRPVPAGVPGELYAGGDGLALGYLNRPELTAEKFIPSPFAAGARLYRTGDIARWRADGNIEYLGRADHQVKIRGYRIELGEIESVLGGYPGISACGVLARDQGGGDKVLTAFVVVRKPGGLDAETLREWLGAKLPDYMVPARFFSVAALPLTPNGKVDRKALEKTDAVELVSGTDYLAPRSQIERDLVEIWKGVLGREKVGVRDNFFHLGGHSLTAVRLTGQVEKVFGCKLPIASLFQSPTIEALARRLGEKDWKPPWSSLVALQPLGSKPPLFFVHGVRGEVYRYLDLIKHLPADQPCYGIQAVGLDDKSARHRTVEEMAAHYVGEILQLQPEGAYYLAGYSMGGLVAYEMARQLQRQGRRVLFLGLLDSGPAGKVPVFFYGLQMAFYLPRRCWFHLRRWFGLPVAERFDYLRRRWRSLLILITRNWSNPPAVAAAPEKKLQGPEVPAGFIDYYHMVASAYQLQPYPGAVDVFVSDQYAPGWKTYWKHLARGGAAFHRIPGQHFEIFNPDNVVVFAQLFRSSLHRAQAKEQDSV